jgi:hypothetical protein
MLLTTIYLHLGYRLGISTLITLPYPPLAYRTIAAFALLPRVVPSKLNSRTAP